MQFSSEAQAIGAFEKAALAEERQIADKWPVWVRILTIVGLSALLWYGIILAITSII